MQNQLNGVSMIPFGLLSCFADEEEVRITELSDRGFQFRTAEEISPNIQFHICFYLFESHTYKEMILDEYQIVKEQKEPFFYTYLVTTSDPYYRLYSQKLMRDYLDYILLKLEEEDGKLSFVRTGYPYHLDEVIAQSFEEQKQAWYQNLAETAVQALNQSHYQTWLPDEVSLAIALDGPEWYLKYLSDRFDDFMSDYWEKQHLSGHPLSVSVPDRLYIGNAHCPDLFPDQRILFPLLEKAVGENLDVTLVFSFLRDTETRQMKDVISQLSIWAEKYKVTLEAEMNDWGMSALFPGNHPAWELNFGVLLNRRRKDVRYSYMPGYQQDAFQKTSVHQPVYLDFLKNKLHITRFEWESTGDNIYFPPGRNSIHFPFYQTNTSSFCPLYAKCVYGDRGKQKKVSDCPEFCKELAFLYPDHLHMVGKYNALFGWNEECLKNPEILYRWKSQGVDRMVIHFL